jgi:hypothetical protein
MKIMPTIVVIAYNRIDSLSRLLESLSSAKIEMNTRLVISIDYSGDFSVTSHANNFEWLYGDKIVITHDANLGLRKHVLKCGDLTEIYGALILLEDDLVVSPMFYQYTQEALEFYEQDNNVAGISLYNHKYNVNAQQTFEPLVDGFDVYWLQFASSWGQAWTVKHWQDFKCWYEKEDTALSVTDDIPTNIVNWPETSWLKYFIKYLVVTNKYFIYPRDSLTANFSDIGTNVVKKDYTFQVGLCLSKQKFDFSSLAESNAIYDVFFEISPEILKKFNCTLELYDFEVDLYGTKRLSNVNKDYLLSNKAINGSPILSFARELRPHDFNIVSNFTSEKISVFNLAETKAFKANENSGSISSSIDYYFYSLPLKKLVAAIIAKVKHKIRSVI